MLAIEEVVCDNCKVYRLIPEGDWFVKCETCSHLVVRTVEKGYKYVQKRCNGSKALLRFTENLKKFTCLNCREDFKIEESVLKKKCGQNVYLATAVKNSAERKVNEDVQPAKLNVLPGLNKTAEADEIAELKKKLKETEKKMAEMSAKFTSVDSERELLLRLGLHEKRIARLENDLKDKDRQIHELNNKLTETKAEAAIKIFDHSRELKVSQEKCQLLEKQLKDETVKCQKLRVVNNMNTLKLQKMLIEPDCAKARAQDYDMMYASKIEKLEKEIEKLNMANTKINDINTAALKKINELTHNGKDKENVISFEEEMELKKEKNMIML